MAFNKLAAWFLSDAGKKFSYVAVGTISVAASLGHLLPHSLLIDQYKSFAHLYKNGFVVPLPEKLQKRFAKALELTDIDEADRHLYKPFSGYGLEIFSAGSAYSSFGVIVGIPKNFTYEKPEDVDRHLIKIRDSSIFWDMPEAQAFMNSLVLSEKAQLFAMAREIKFRATAKPMIDAAAAVVCVLATYGITNGINERGNLYVKPLMLRAGLYILVGAFTLGTYFLCKDYSQVYLEHKIDTELKAKNPIFAEGGKEFYHKLVERNKGLRKLLGEEGESYYTALGNEKTLFRYKHLPAVDRKLLFESETQ